MKAINCILAEVQTISDFYDRQAIESGEDFNIFFLLKVEADEVTTHSRFIAELLDRKGTHRQGSIFLKKFVNYFNIDPFDTESSQVIVEHFIGNLGAGLMGGRIDIFISDFLNSTLKVFNPSEFLDKQK